MNLSKELDLAIKFSETGSTKGAYIAEKEYDTYMTNSAWNDFISAMGENARLEYLAGGGDELTAKNGKPPKMACYGSSSRMIYNLSHKKAGFHFEKKLPTTIGGTANLDGFLEEPHRYVFVEAKCHEPYSTKNASASKVYAELYDHINENMPESLYIEKTISTCGKYLNVKFIAEGEELEYFDLKQIISHLLGIATALLNRTFEQKQTDFIYLLYDPTELDLADGVREKIESVYERCVYECNLIDFATLFRVIIEFLIENKQVGDLTFDEVEGMIFNFTFTLASQDFYPLLIE